MKKVLIITYYWPPAGGPGVQRWLKFVKYLPEFNIQPTVYCPENPSYPTLDSSLLQEVDSKITVLKHPIKEPLRFLKLLFKSKTNKLSKGGIPDSKKQGLFERFLLYIRGNFFVPDARVFWVKPSVKYLSSYISKHQIDTIITTGPPHSVHLIGMQLKAKYQLQWLADFRDPWTDISYHKNLNLTKNTQQNHLKLEHQVLNTSDQIIVTSSQTKQLLSKITQQPISVITNGFDDENVPSITLDSKFSLTHIGSLLNQRNPILLWNVLSELVQEIPKFKANFQLVLVGNVSADVRTSIDSRGLTSFLKTVGSVTHNEAVMYQRKTQVLLLLEANTTEASYIIPGKLFEYINSNRPIVALGPKHSDIPSILKDTHTGRYFDYDNKTALKTHILELFEGYKTNSLSVSSKDIERFSRKNCTKQLAEVLYSK
ncbi:glycosyl transferase family 1 [Flavobacteriaceae bacterium]|nr:glycosyl transferase family 1 [Flavobacteriaceae bacterium]